MSVVATCLRYLPRAVRPRNGQSLRVSSEVNHLPQEPSARTRLQACLAAAIALLASAHVASADAQPTTAELRATIDAMKLSPKGPFEAIRWFCKDGAVLPPGPGACRDRGGGVQHGQWSEATRRLRGQGYYVANVLAGLDFGPWLGASAELASLLDLLLERFLIEADNGWILRGARNYRGALQAEDEEAAAQDLLLAMSTDPAWLAPSRFLLLREAARLLPAHGSSGATEARQLAGALAEVDPGFATLRNKIHSLPDADDGRRVREYSARAQRADLKQRYGELARRLEELYDEKRSADQLEELARKAPRGPLRRDLEMTAARLRESRTPRDTLRDVGVVLAAQRDALESYGTAERALALRAGLVLERVAFSAANEIREQPATSPRRWSLDVLSDLREALYGSGLISARERAALRDSEQRLRSGPTLLLGDYRRELAYMARAAGWAGRAILFHFGARIDRLADLDPLVREYAPDRLRGSPLLAWNAILDVLQLDAAEMAGATHTLFGDKVGSGLRGLNPGLARGVLHSADGSEALGSFSRTGIYLLPETVSDLPPVAGILTRGEGSSLSHVQLLARNLGIPNVVVGQEWVPALQAREGESVVLAVSPQGLVELSADGPRWQSVFGREEPDLELRIRPDLAKLDLSDWHSVPLSWLRASDSGRIAGPKAANLGELWHLYGDAVPGGVVVPFGAFRRLIDQPLRPGGPSVFAWMRERYAEIRALRDQPDVERDAESRFLAELRAWIEQADPGEEFRTDLRRMLAATVGADGTYGVFVRSDTNVEDLPGFTGAGLNLTVPNVVGFENVMRALGRVWASPFTERAYAWRQAHMDEPEYVFPGVVLQVSFPSEKSGVLVTVDVDTGDPHWLSIAVSEGVGGAVEGQAAEELRVRRDGSEVRLLARATSPFKAVLSRGGGLERVPASGADQVLSSDEIAQLVALCRDLGERFPGLGTGSDAVPADVEFAFRDGRLSLLQIRPFVESRRARRLLYLQQLDRALAQTAGLEVALDGAPVQAAGSP